MPTTTQKAAVGFGQGLKAHAKDETTYGQDFSKLPPGISNGEAILIEAKRGVYKTGKNTGQPFLHLRGVVQEPQAVTYSPKFWAAAENGQPAGIRVLPPVTQKVAGLQTSLTLPACATQKKGKDGNDVTVTAEDNAAHICNELRKLGGDDCLDSLANLPSGTTDAQAFAALDPILDALIGRQPNGAKQPFIRFKIGTRAGNPSAQYPEPTVFEEWYGTQGLAAAEPGAEPPADAVDASEQPQETTTEAPTDGEPDIDVLLAAANGGDKAAQTALTEAAVAAGHSQEDAEGAESWDAVVDRKSVV